MKSCQDCGYIEEIKYDAGGVDSLGSYFDHSYSTFKCRKFGLEINDDNKHMADRCTSYIMKGAYREKCLNGEIDNRDKQTQIILDFSSLKEVMSKGGLVMTSYKCPNCSGMVNLPEAGKVLVCQYCGTPIKPVDVFEKIKALIQ